MPQKLKRILLFTITLVFLLAAGLGTHLSILSYYGYSLFDDLLIRSYLLNALVTIILYIVLANLPERLNGNMGFLFMGGSLLKFVLFFIFFYPVYQQDGDMDRQEFFAFFTPYAIALIWETISLVRQLKRS